MIHSLIFTCFLRYKGFIVKDMFHSFVTALHIYRVLVFNLRRAILDQTNKAGHLACRKTQNEEGEERWGEFYNEGGMKAGGPDRPEQDSKKKQKT